MLAFHWTNLFLDGRWTWYGLEVFAYYQLPPEEQRIMSRTNPMCYVFPRIAACNYYRFVKFYIVVIMGHFIKPCSFCRYGTGGRQEALSAICILALNIINDKIFLVLWWWFFFLFFIGLSRLLFRIIQVMFEFCSTV